LVKLLDFGLLYFPFPVSRTWMWAGNA